MNIIHKIGELYANYLRQENQKNTNERYVGREHFYHASGTGMCSRKLYFQSVDKVKPTNLPNNASMRKMRIGTLLHQDIQNSLILYNNIYNNITNHNITKKNYYLTVHTHTSKIVRKNTKHFFKMFRILAKIQPDRKHLAQIAFP